MALPARRVSRRALTASASRLRTPEESAYGKRMTMPWQYRALTQFDMIPELHYANHFIARQLSRCRFYPAHLNEDGTTEPYEDGSPPVLLWDRIQDPGGGRSQLQYSYGRLIQITGEGVLLGYRLNAPDERWKFLWKDEVKIFDDGTAVRLDWEMKETSDFGVAYRMWTPHPRHSDLPDSPMQAVSDIAEELIILTQSVRSTAVTRMTKGMTVIPLEAIPDPIGEYLGDEDPQTNQMLMDYVEHVSAQIENYGSAEASVPFLFTPSYEYADRIFQLKMHDPATDYMEKDLRKEAIERLALGLDMPPEALLGMGGSNHWSSKGIQFDMWRSHGVQKADQFGDDMCDVYLRPALRDEEFSDWSRVVLVFDDSLVVVPPDQSTIAKDALDRAAISFQGFREMSGIPESMAPDEDEQALLLSVKMRTPVEIENGEMVPLAGPTANGNGADPSDGPPAPSNGRAGSREEAMRASIQGWAEAGLLRCRSLAGRRLRHDCPDCAQGTPPALVASVLGPSSVKDPRKLVQDGTEEFQLLLASVLPTEQVVALGQMLEVYAARTLCEEQPPLPSGFIAAIEKAREEVGNV